LFLADDLRNLPVLGSVPTMPHMGYQALLFCPEEKIARVVTQVLSELEFSVESCTEPFAAVKRLTAQHFDAVLVDCDNEQNATLLFKSARNSGPNQSSLALAVVEGQSGVAKAFRLGANLVLTKPINLEQCKGTLRVARGLLRKAEAVKSATMASASAPAEQPACPADSNVASEPQLPPTPPVKTAFSLPAQEAPSISAATASTSVAFELEQQPGPPPGPAEAALMEYMPDPAPVAADHPAHPAPTSVGSKEYPWQPVSKPLAEPMASALRRAAEAAGKAETDSAATSKATTVPQAEVADATKDKESWPAGSTSSTPGTATAPAPVMETWPSAKTLEPKPAATRSLAPKKGLDKPEIKKPWTTAGAEIAAPTFSSLGDAQSQEAAQSGRSKKMFLVAALALLMAGAGYFGWRKMHPMSGKPAVQQQLAPVPASATPAATPQAPSTNSEASAPSPSTPPEVSETPAQAQQAQKEVAAPSPQTPSPKPSAAIPASDARAKTVPAAKAREPIVVKTELSKKSNSQSGGEESPQPPAAGGFGLASNPALNPDDKAISGIVSTTPLRAPRPAPQALRISQGMSQGMLLKQVQPIYPPQARQMRLEGAVQLQASIGKDGSITNLKQLSGDAVLGRAAIDAVRQWKYKPYSLNGEPVEVQTQVTVNFKLP
jgi:protein TonB